MGYRDDDFDFVNLPPEAQDPEIKAEDFTLQQADGSIHEQKFQNKPTTFFKDSIKRFGKNKSSVIATYILGALVLLALFVPVFNKNDVSTSSDSALKNLQPKLFDGGGFWDGTIKVKHKEVDADGNPDPSIYSKNGIKNLVLEGEQFTNTPNKFGRGGYVETGFYAGNNESYLYSTNPLENSPDTFFTLVLDPDDPDHSELTLTNFVVADEQMLIDDLGDDGVVPENFKIGLTSLEFCYYKDEEAVEPTVIELVSPAEKQTIGMEGGASEVPLNDKILNNPDGLKTFNNFFFRFAISKSESITEEDHVCSLIKSMVITTTSTNDNEKLYFSPTVDESTLISGISFNDAMQMMIRTYEVGAGSSQRKNDGYWNISNSTRFFKKIYLAKCYFASFTYDSYEATLGTVENFAVSCFDLEKYAEKGWIDYTIIIIEGVVPYVDPYSYEFTILNHDKCPIISEPSIEDITDIATIPGGYEVYNVKTAVTYYKYLGYDKMPKFIFGTDKTGRDMFKYVFEGLRNSLALGVIVFLICFTFGLIFGAIAGYFGGTVDLILERFVEIVGGIPSIVLVTVIVLKAGSSFGTFILALCLTGWIGTSGITRAQFYRFRGREYVLASRTLGASDARLIARHILPNSLGTIITNSVLMIPRTIFIEASFSYLGIGFKNLSSLGAILSNNQQELNNHPYQLIFPAVVIALVMISFNLFGNGLRDAFNPSLKGEDE